MIWVIKKSKLCVVIILIAVLVVGIIGALQLSKATSFNASVKDLKKVPIYNVETEKNDVAISFDAAWGADKTLKILDILDTYEMKATFFLVGFWVDEYPDLVIEIKNRGHNIGNHSTNHPHFNKLSATEKEMEIETTAKKIEELTGEYPQFFRAPFGEYNDELMSILEAKKTYGIQWSVDSLDWKGIEGKVIADRVLKKVKKGDIILCHNNSEHILEALPIIILGVKNKGLNFVGLDQLVIKENYYINNNGTQIYKAE
ncbi:MAG: polysaccharide deacetylase family protein [Clostridia bacterium]